MPFPRSQLNIILCSKDPDWQPTPIGAEKLRTSLQAHGISTLTELDSQTQQWVVGGFRRLHLQRHLHPSLVANHQGGYRVNCRQCNALITGLFVKAIQAYRAGGSRELQCSDCGELQDLNALIYRPHAAFVSFEVQLHNVQSVELTAFAMDFFHQHIPEMQLIFKRLG